MIKLNKRFGVNLGIYAVVVLIALVLTSFLVYQNYFNSGADVVLPDISIDSSQKFQTITGWEVTAYSAAEDSKSFNLYQDDLFNRVANDAEVNRVRLSVQSGLENQIDYYDLWKKAGFPSSGADYLSWRAHRYATVNDNADPNNIDLNGFKFSRLDDTMNQVILPLKSKFDAKGEHLQINLEYVAFTRQIDFASGLKYIHNDPKEYAEYMLAVSNYLKTKYNIVPETWEILLEPDNVPEWNGTLLGQAIVETAAKLKTSGFQPRFIVPSTTNMGNAITYFNKLVAVPGVLPYIEEISYHRYGGVSDANLQAIANLAKQYNLKTSMLEWWDNNNTYKTLHKDLKMGFNSAWEQGAIAGRKVGNPNTSLYIIDDLTDPNNPTIEIHPKTKFFRQYYKYIRPGAVRIGATSSTANYDPLSFINSNGKYTVEIDALAAGSFTVSNLPAGTYGVKYATASVYDIDNPDVTINTGQKLTTSIPAVGLVTIYQKSAKDVTAPLAPTSLSASYTNQQAALTWVASTDNINVSGYNIYRNSTKIGSSAATTFTDSTVASSQQYSYEVTAFDADNNESAKNSSVNLTIPDFQSPVLAPVGNKSVQVGKKLQFTITATDPDGNTLTYSASSLPSGANFNPSTKTFDWTPTSAQVGVNSNIGFSVSDGINTDSENIAITVTANNPPVLAPIGNQSVAVGTKLQFIISATDKDGDTLTYSATNLPSVASFDATARTFTWTPNSPQVGSFFNVAFSASDGIDTDIQLISIMVTPDVTPPTAPSQFKANFNSSTGQVNLSWQAGTDNLGVSGYQLSRSTLAGLSFQVIASVNSATLSFDDKQISAGKTYYYRIQTFDNPKNYSTSASASTKTYIVDKTAPTAPTLKAVVRKNGRSAEIRWTNSTDDVAIKGYLLYKNNVQITPNSAYATGFKIGTDGKPWYNETAVQPGQTYSYRVVAQDTSGNLSTNSNTSSITVPKDIQISNINAARSNNTTTISWKTNVKSIANITYSKRYLFGIHLSNQTYIETKTGYDHTVTLSNIDPKAKYDFQITAINAEKTENKITTTPLSF